MKVGVFGSSSKLKNVETVREIVQWLREAGYETVEFRSQKEIADVDVVLVLGGDGAILHSALFAAQHGVKIIGVNYGTLGFLAECVYSTVSIQSHYITKFPENQEIFGEFLQIILISLEKNLTHSPSSW